MAVITFANTKGGAGKTTAVLLLASELARRGLRICVIDTDPQRWLSKWREAADHRVDLSVITYVSATSLQQHVLDNRRKFDHVIVDLPGAQSPLLATAVGLSNHVLIPVQGSTMDAQGGAQVLELLRYLDDRASIKIPHSVVLSRVNSMVTTRALLAAKVLLAKRNVHVLDTPIIERAAFRDMFDFGGYLHMMNPSQVSNLDKALINANAFADEVMRLLPAQSVARYSSAA
ncbi:ParA family protein [Rhizobium sp. Leaf262]|uniref:ParA family protein n=1 Tax=Rhizobium sp. Leaf262 TaxID=1736312 RepID=UPI0007125FE8|nr:ParA family protein [Rhizobium sp. Leaf262]KQO83930.1 chromosome partitioning protein ParA [Rhizobium sp. Leaf262]